MKSFDLKGKMDFDESSIWFSYGSNLNPWYFEQKMKEKGSPLGLKSVKKGSISRFTRALDNRSKSHGLAYAIHPEGGPTSGIAHEVPSSQLPFFLRMEGVLNEDFKVKNSNYEIIEVNFSSDDAESVPTIPAFSLMGAKKCDEDERLNRVAEHHLQLDDYIRAAVSGARTQGIDETPFLDDLEWLKRIRQT